MSFTLTQGYLPISLPPFCLALPTMTQFSDWLHSSLGSLSTSVNGYRHCSLCLMYVFLPKFAAKSLYLWSSPILSGCSSRCPWYKPQLPIFPPQEALLVGYWVTSSPILSGHSSKCPWYKPQLPIFPPQGSFTGRSLGDCLTTFLLWHPLFSTSYRGSLVWGGAGTPVPCMTAAHTQGNANL